MSSLADVPFDVFCSIFKWSDPLALQVISETNTKFREWSSSPALWKELIRRMQAEGLSLPPSSFTDIQAMSFEELKKAAIRAQRIKTSLTSRDAYPSRSLVVDCAPGKHRGYDGPDDPSDPASQAQVQTTRGRMARSASDGENASGAIGSGSGSWLGRNVRAAGRRPGLPGASPLHQSLLQPPPSPSLYQTTQRIRWVIAIAPNWFAVKLGYHMSSGFLQIWFTGATSNGCEEEEKEREVVPRIVMQYRHDWVMWGAVTDLQRKCWYFLLTEDGPGVENASHGHTMRLLRFSGFSADRTVPLQCATTTSFPSYGTPITAFFLSITHQRLAILYTSTSTRTIHLFFTPDWDAKECALVDTNIPETYEKSSFLCTWEEEKGRLRLQYDTLPKLRGRVLAYSLGELMQHAESGPPRAFSTTRTPPKIVSEEDFEINFEPFRGRPRRVKVEGEPPYVPMHELRSAVFCDHDFVPASNPPEKSINLPERTSVLSFSATYGTGGRDLHPSYVFEHHVAMRIPTQEETDKAPWDSYFVYSGAKILFSRRLRTPFITRMAYEQDYMDQNSAERFPVGHALDLRGHELAALGQGMAVWIEVKEGAPVGSRSENVEFELKAAMFPSHHNDPLVSFDRGEGEEGTTHLAEGEHGIAVCTVHCPPEVDLATVTGIWLDAVQGQIFLGLKWGKFAILRFS